jgi:NAD(P)-dependent dehydrogenase (short-subunit alcohol dehydrogenase family)
MMGERSIFDVTGRVALVTGGGHGLGREICEAMAEFGADVACSDIDKEGAEETVKLIERFGNRAIAVQADVSKPDEIERMVKETVSELGTIDILFANAGIGHPPANVHEMPLKEWDRIMRVNLGGVGLSMRAVLPIMLKQKRGSIICTASNCAIVAGGVDGKSRMNMPAYTASKAGIIGLIKEVALEYARDGIRVNAIAPGGHDTKPRGLSIPPEKIAEMTEYLNRFIPMGRLGEPREIKGLAVYLASDASSYVTGQVFVQDGGFVA